MCSILSTPDMQARPHALLPWPTPAYANPCDLRAAAKKTGYFYTNPVALQCKCQKKIAQSADPDRSTPSLTQVKRNLRGHRSIRRKAGISHAGDPRSNGIRGELFPKSVSSSPYADGPGLGGALPKQPAWAPPSSTSKEWQIRLPLDRGYRAGSFATTRCGLQLHALAYNLATFLRCIALPEAMADWSFDQLTN